jgi:tripartite-type tricarboxylate transporter receptor subunit TctC
MKSVLTRMIAAIALAAVPLAAASAQDFPSKPVRFVVPYAAGGSGDLLARLLVPTPTAIPFISRPTGR